MTIEIADMLKVAYEIKISDGLIFSIQGTEYKMPNAWHRFWFRVLLGWVVTKGGTDEKDT